MGIEIKKWLYSFIIAGLFIVAAEPVSFAEDARECGTKSWPDVKAGDRAPGFSLKNISGKEVSLEDFKDKIVVLNYFATWSLPGIEPALVKIRSAYSIYKEVVFISIAAETGKGKEEALSYINKYKIDWEVLFDYNNSDYNHSFHSLYKLNSIPTNFIINKEGKISFIWLSFEKDYGEDILKKEINKVLEE